MTEYSTVIFGATISGIAAAIEKPNDIIIIEESMLLGNEFIDSMNIKSCNSRPQTESAQSFSADLKKRGLLNENGELHVFPVSGLLASYVRNNKANILLMTFVISVESCREGFLITIFNTDGYSELYAGKIIDTTSEGTFLQLPDNVQRNKYLCAMLHSDVGGNIEGYRDESASVLKGKFTNEYVLKVNMKEEDDWVTARKTLHDYWSEHVKTVFKGWKIASVASTFAYDFTAETSVEVQNKWIWKPSASHSDLISAYEGGIECAALI